MKEYKTKNKNKNMIVKESEKKMISQKVKNKSVLSIEKIIKFEKKRLIRTIKNYFYLENLGFF